ncbi:cytochrome C [Pararhodobacter sp. SW119]|uniref:c-type cytochrome n=1 Tax=Pararhodobacter sp. SW119 TaxID=2780075 RepID=UPI001AE050FF|nr:cytochrome C [Pararhodobacter sp. SW119]
MFRKTALFAASAAAMTFTGWAAQAGDPAAGEAQWRQCRSCHMITAPDGEVIQRGGRVGPNLHGVIGQRAGSVDGFRYSEELAAAGNSGLVWDEASFVAYVEDPTGFIRQQSGNDRARSPMNFQMRSGAEDMYAYLATFSN